MKLRTWAKQLSGRAKRLPVWTVPGARLVLAVAWLSGVAYLVYELVCALHAPGQNVFGDVRAILLTLAAWIGAPFLIWRTLLADKQTQINQESHYTDLFTKAIESLGATRTGESGVSEPVIETRIGAIFALERLAKHSRSDYDTIIETLSAYIREQCGKPSLFKYSGADPDEEGIPPQEKESRLWDWCRALRKWVEELKDNATANRADVVVALTVLSRRREGRHWSRPIEHEAQPNLGRANLQGWKMVNDEIVLHDPELRLADAYLEGATMSGFYMENSPILGIQIQHEMTQSLVQPRSLVGVQVFALTLRNAQYFPILDCAILSYAHMDGAKCGNARFRGAVLVGADFRNAMARNAKFGCANASRVKFDGADLSHTEFVGALLHGVNFLGADLRHSEFYGAVFQETELEGALLVGADLTGAKGLEAGMIERAFGTTNTRLPRDVARPDHWADEASAVQEWIKFKRERGFGVPG